MSLLYQRRLASHLLKKGKSKIWIDPEAIEDVGLAVTKVDLRKLIAKGSVRAKARSGISSARSKAMKQKKLRGLRSGPGSRKGSYASSEEEWVRKVRSQREFIKRLRKRRILTPAVSRKLYLKVKGNAFENIAQIKTYIKDNELARR